MQNVDTFSAAGTEQISQVKPRNGRLFDNASLDADLKGRSVRGGAVTLLAQGSKLIIQTVSALALARLLTPEDYGLVGMVGTFTGFAALFTDLGLSTATIQAPEIRHRQISTIFWVNMASSLLLALVVVALAPAVAWFYGEPRLTLITEVLAVPFVLGGLTVQHQALLRRQMRFTALAIIEVLALLFGVTIAILAAILGAGYWSLIAMLLAGPSGVALGVWLASNWWPGLPTRWSDARGMLAFGAHLTGFHVLNYFARNVDNILIGRVWGAHALGFYSKAYGLLTLPLAQITAPVTAIAVVTLSRLSKEPDRYRSCYRRCLSLIAFVTMPVAVFLVVMSDEVIHVVLGPQWSEAAHIFMFLGIAALWQPVASSTGWLLVSQGRTAEMFWWGAAASFVTVCGIVLGLPWGTTGVAAFYTLFNGATIPALFWLVGRKGPVAAWDICRALAMPLYVSLGVLPVLLVLHALCHGMSASAALFCATTVTVSVAVTLLFAVPAGSQLRADMWDIFRTIFIRR